jgi:hypothetical protein
MEHEFTDRFGNIFITHQILTTEEISKRLPCLVFPKQTSPLLRDDFILFNECRDIEGMDWQITGTSLDGRKRVMELQKETLYRVVTGMKLNEE